MERKRATDFPPEVLKLFDQYVHGWMSRRDFLDKRRNVARFVADRHHDGYRRVGYRHDAMSYGASRPRATALMRRSDGPGSWWTSPFIPIEKPSRRSAK